MILITGATDGIGRQIAIELARRFEPMLLHGRNSLKLEILKKELKDISSGLRVETIQSDFRSLQHVESMAQTILNKYPSVNIVINNAGTYEKRFSLSADGYESTYAVNFLAHYSLTLQLVPMLVKSVKSRIIHVSSMTHEWAKPDISRISDILSYEAGSAYALSKLLNLVLSVELNRRLHDYSVCSTALHPGVIDTKLLRAGWSGGDSVEEGAQTPVFLATKPWDKSDCGKYFESKTARSVSVHALDPDFAKEVFLKAELDSGVYWPL